MSWGDDEHLACIPPLDVEWFGTYRVPLEYREALHLYAPYYCAEEIVGSFLGLGTFPSYDEWVEAQNYIPSDDEDLNLMSDGEAELSETSWVE